MYYLSNGGSPRVGTSVNDVDSSGDNGGKDETVTLLAVITMATAVREFGQGCVYENACDASADAG